MTTCVSEGGLARRRLLERGVALEWLTVTWNVVEALVAIGAATHAGSIALLGFGIDSVVESLSGGILLWRLKTEQRGDSPRSIEALDRRARQLVAASLILLALYVAGEAVHALWNHHMAKASLVGILVTSISLGVMWWLAGAKRETARALGSRALEADSFQTTACWWLSLIVLAGIALNAALGWWWADPAAALAMTYFLVREARQAWRGEECCA